MNREERRNSLENGAEQARVLVDPKLRVLGDRVVTTAAATTGSGSLIG